MSMTIWYGAGISLVPSLVFSNSFPIPRCRSPSNNSGWRYHGQDMHPASCTRGCSADKCVYLRRIVAPVLYSGLYMHSSSFELVPPPFLGLDLTTIQFDVNVSDFLCPNILHEPDTRFGRHPRPAQITGLRAQHCLTAHS